MNLGTGFGWSLGSVQRKYKMTVRTMKDIADNYGKEIADVAAASTAVGAYLSYLPEIAAGLAALWTLIRIFEWVYEKWRICRAKGEKDEEQLHGGL